MIRNVHLDEEKKEGSMRLGRATTNSAFPTDAQFIRFGHQDFDLVLNIMLGIKRSVDSLIDSPFYEISDIDYQIKFSYKNQWLSKTISKYKVLSLLTHSLRRPSSSTTTRLKSSSTSATATASRTRTTSARLAPRTSW